MNPHDTNPRGLLRRLLKQAEEQAGQSAPEESIPADLPEVESQQSQPPAPEPEARPTPPPAAPTAASVQTQSVPSVAPIRPTSPDETVEPQQQIAPQPVSAQKPLITVEERLKAEEALESIRQKTSQIASEFAEGKLNRAQFTAMYAHINEKRTIIERMLARNPDTQAWQSVARPGHTSFLKQHFEARVLSYTIYDNGTTDPTQYIAYGAYSGSGPLAEAIAQPILQALAILLKTRTPNKVLRALRRQIENDQWVAIIPGLYTSALALFSLEPSSQQFTLVVDIHRDFERANRVVLERGIRLPDQLVFPHRALFTKPGQSTQTMPPPKGS